ncbi:Kelch domain-containing protein 3 [Lamellibrachia satsuma]|nr:Kelch domain-containing protein 3 [Lamellibrachia satsuma]
MHVLQGRPPHWRDFHSATGFGGCMYIFGGRGDLSGPYHTSNEVYCNKIQVFNTLTGMWHEPVTTGNAPPGRRSHSAFPYNGELYIFGGFDGFHNIHFDDLYKFNPVKNQWSLVSVGGEGPCPRRRQCCCVIGDRVFLFGGTSPCPQPHSDAEHDLMDHSDLYVLDLSPSLCTLCMLVVLKHGLDRNCLPKDIRWELAAMTTNSNISRPLNMSG